MVRNTRASSCLELPPRYVSTIVVDPDEAERTLYAAVMAAMRSAAEPRARRTAGLLLLEAGSSPAAVRTTLDNLGGEPRLAELRGAARIDETRKGRALVEIVRTGGGAQVLVFTRYRATARWLVELPTAGSPDLIEAVPKLPTSLLLYSPAARGRPDPAAARPSPAAAPAIAELRGPGSTAQELW